MGLDVAIVISIVLAFGFALLQFAQALGAPFGAYVLGGTHTVLPPRMRIVSGSFSLIFAVVGVAFLHKANAIDGIFPSLITNILLAAYTLFLGFAVIGNGFITKSKKERYVMTPFSIIGFLCGVIVLVQRW